MLDGWKCDYFRRFKSVQSVMFFFAFSDFFIFDLLCMGLFSAQSFDASITVSHKLSAGIPSNLRPASNEIISASVLLCETAVCLLRHSLIDTSVLLPKKHNKHPDVDLESARSLARSASWKRPSLHWDVVVPT